MCGAGVPGSNGGTEVTLRHAYHHVNIFQLRFAVKVTNGFPDATFKLTRTSFMGLTRQVI